jgi:PAS domain S-box-containing protein
MISQDETGERHHDQNQKGEANKTPEKQFTGCQAQFQSTEIKKQPVQKPHDLSSRESYNRKAEAECQVFLDPVHRKSHFHEKDNERLTLRDGLMQAAENLPIYNSRIIKNYIEYLILQYPHVAPDPLLDFAGMSREEVEDPAHWFTQSQCDRFHEALAKKIGNPNVWREVGRYAASSKASGVLKQYAMSFLSPLSAYRLLEKITPHLTKGGVFRTTKLGSKKVEISFIPVPGVKEHPPQCENRMGQLEAITKVFTNKFAKIEHPTCLHKNGDLCRYVVTWDEAPSQVWKRVSRYSVLAGFGLALVFSFFLPLLHETILTLAIMLGVLLVNLYAGRLEKEELAKSMVFQGDAAETYLGEMQRRYNQALLVQELGQVCSTVFDIRELTEKVMEVLEKRLNFDRGMILLLDGDKRRLRYTAGYGFTKSQEEPWRETGMSLDGMEESDPFVSALRKYKPVLLHDAEKNQKKLSWGTRQIVKETGMSSIAVVPIVHKRGFLGLIAVGNLSSAQPLTQSDVNLLSGIASEAALGIINALSFQKLRDSEKKYRELVENANSIILRRDPSGKITFFNEYAQRFFGLSEKEILGRTMIGTIVPEKDSLGNDQTEALFEIGADPGKFPTHENEAMRNDGERVWVSWTNKALRDPQGRIVEILSIGNDVTALREAEREKKSLEARLQRAEKMEAIGSLAGGVAHDLNNILPSLISFPDVILMDLPEDSPLRKPVLSIKRSGERAAAIAQDLLTLARRAVPVKNPVHLNEVVEEYLDSPEGSKLQSDYPKVKISKELDDGLKPILGSPVHLSKTLMNLVLNAVEAIPEEGSVVLSTRGVQVKEGIKGYEMIEPGDYAVLSVKDTGVGISARDIEKIFEPFYTKKSMGRSGSGLGMAIVWGTVKDHRGYVDVKSEKGKGTTFDLYFPVPSENPARP